MKNRSFLKDNWDIITVLALYCILSVFSFHYFQYMIGGDEISYIDIAQDYAVGDWGTAINGYWSPLYSWLMAPFLVFGSNPLQAVYISKIVSLIIGFFTIISIRKLSRTLKLNITIERTFLFALVPSIMFFSILYPTPDLLLVCILSYYLSIILDSQYSKNLINGVLCGFIGAVAYLTKSFAFPFFLVHFISFNLIFFVRGLKIEKRNVLKNMFLGLLVFFVVSGLWAGTISEKYDKLTISTAGDYNQALVGPEYQVNAMGYGEAPIYYLGLIKPPNNTISIWSDPTYIKMDHWSPIHSWTDFEYELKLVWSNIIYTFKIIESFMPIAVIILISMVLFILRSKKDITAKNSLKYLLLTMLIYMGGYCLIIPEWRYLWFIFVLLMVSSFYIVDRLYKSQVLTLNIRNILLILLVVSFVLQPVIEAGVYYAAPDDRLYNLSSNLKDNYRIQGNIASNDEWMEMLTISYYLNSKYYGTNMKTNNSTDLERELVNNNIDYYFVWHTTEVLKLSDFREITNGEINDLRIYVRN